MPLAGRRSSSTRPSGARTTRTATRRCARSAFRSRRGYSAWVPALSSGAVGRQRAHGTSRPRTCTDRRAEIHDRLRVVGDALARRVGVGVPPELVRDGRQPGPTSDGVITREHAFDVAVQDRPALAVSLREDRARRGAADAGQRVQIVERRGQLAAVLGDDAARRAPEVASARVIAEAGPERQHVVERHGRERRDRRKAPHETLVERNHGADLRLLQHDLGDPDGVRRAGVLPREIVAAVRVEPREQSRRERHHRERVREGGSTGRPSSSRASRSMPVMARCPPCDNMRFKAHGPMTGGTKKLGSISSL